MAKGPAKTLGRPDAPCLKAFEARALACEKPVLAAWCLDTAESRFLPLYESACPGDARPRQALAAARAWLAGGVKLPFVRKAILGGAHAAAREAESQPAARAAARAVGHAASVIHARRHALGLAYYGAAALAYDRLGTDGNKAEYELVFERLCLELAEGLARAEKKATTEEQGIEQ